MRATKKSGEILAKYVELTKKLGDFPNRTQIETIVSERQVRKHFGNLTALRELAIKTFPELLPKTDNKAKVLIVDIETAPILGYVWGLWDNNLGLNQVNKDWHLLSWSAKWLGAPPSEVMYMDQRSAPNIEDDSKILKGIWDLLDEADIVITQNGKSFDHKKLNARFILNKIKPPSTYKHIDTLRIAKKHFGFTSNKLEYMTDKLCTKYKKLKHHRFSGFELWKECLAGNIDAWKEMEKYNKYDVLSLEELYTKLIPWDSSVDFNLYTDDSKNSCKCGNSELTKLEGKFYYTSRGRYQKYTCKQCGAESRGNINLFPVNKRASLKAGISR